jgi:hypothetical protein
MPRVYTRKPAVDRVMAKVVVIDDHWIWTGSVGSSGYGKVTAPGRDGRDLLTHRVVWEHHNGPIPEGLVLDHTEVCLRILCCNPNHLEPVTQAENQRRKSSRRVQCAAGHDYTPENTFIGNNGRECRICHAQRERDRRARRRTASQAKYAKVCRRGHVRTPENTWLREHGPTCRDCMADSARARRQRETALLDKGSTAMPE